MDPSEAALQQCSSRASLQSGHVTYIIIIIIIIITIIIKLPDQAIASTPSAPCPPGWL
jgi:hypothetical protein